MTATKIKLESFGPENYASLISWVESEEALMQFAGPLFKFPLTAEQLHVSLSDKNRIAYRVVDSKTGLGIGHAEIYLSEGSAKIGRILIGDKEQRGNGLGKQVVDRLLDIAFNKPGILYVELNVFAWNLGALMCYQKAGFTINPDKTYERKIKDKTWTAVNMSLYKAKYEKIKAN